MIQNYYVDNSSDITLRYTPASGWLRAGILGAWYTEQPASFTFVSSMLSSSGVSESYLVFSDITKIHPIIMVLWLQEEGYFLPLQRLLR